MLYFPKGQTPLSLSDPFNAYFPLLPILSLGAKGGEEAPPLPIKGALSLSLLSLPPVINQISHCSSSSFRSSFLPPTLLRPTFGIAREVYQNRFFLSFGNSAWLFGLFHIRENEAHVKPCGYTQQTQILALQHVCQ